jgi:hypothetical protein
MAIIESAMQRVMLSHPQTHRIAIASAVAPACLNAWLIASSARFDDSVASWMPVTARRVACRLQ